MNAQTVVFGTVFMDCKGFAAYRYDPFGRNVGSVKFIHGGVGRNVAEDLAAIGARVKFVSSVDDSALGAEVLARLAKEGVDVGAVRKSAHSGMGLWLVVMDEKGALAGSVSQMPDLSIMDAIVRDEGEKLVQEASCIVLELDLNDYISSEVLRLAVKHDKKIYGITGNMEVILRHREFLRSLECYICNDAEAGRLFDAHVAASDPKTALAMLDEYIKKEKIKSMVITLGEHGAVYSDGSSRGYCPAIPTKVVDSSGAGDAFFAGTMEALSRGCALSEAVEKGTKLASLTIQVIEPTCTSVIDRLF